MAKEKSSSNFFYQHFCCLFSAIKKFRTPKPPASALWSDQVSFKSLYARVCIRETLVDEFNAFEAQGPRNLPLSNKSYVLDRLPPDPLFSDEVNQTSARNGQCSVSEETLKAAPVDAIPDEQEGHKICIVGAGVAGLYIAMILDYLAIPSLKYEILEANSRVGGRVHTHYFSNDEYDYYDIGAMRFPDIPPMRRLFSLFQKTKVPLERYHLDGGAGCPKLFNNRLLDSHELDPHRVGRASGGYVPDEVVARCGELVKDEFALYKEYMKKDLKKGFRQLMKSDDFSTREFLRHGGPDSTRPKYDLSSVQWMELQNTSSGSFGRSFGQNALTALDSETDASSSWWRINGGAALLTDAMHKLIEQKVETKKRVTAIAIDRENTAATNMSVQIQGEDEPRKGFSTVFNTTTLGALARVDLTTLELHPSQRDAIRSLRYEDSTKIALKFKYPWWVVHCDILGGGIATTDLPLRLCVYPSYNVDGRCDKPAVLLASYTKGQDARRLGLLSSASTEDGKLLIDLILRDLAKLHAKHMTYEMMRDAYAGEYHAFSWGHDPYSCGAFASFGPGQFKRFYPYLTRPAAQAKFHMVGEASSAHTGWAVGALDSAYSAVYKFLRLYEMKDAIERLENHWGHADELETGYRGTAHLQIELGKLRDGEHIKVK